MAGAKPKDAVLVGAAGELWTRDGTRWLRREKGGVAATLVAARGPSVTEVWGLGAAVPPYHHDGTTWSARPLRGGASAALSVGGLLAVAAGRRVHVRASADAKWTELPLTAKGTEPAVSVWAGGVRDVLLVTADGALLRFDGKWKPIATTSRITLLLAGPTGPVYAAPEGGGVVRVDKATVKALAVDTALGAAFAPRLAAAGGKTLYLIGDTTIDGKAGRVLAKIVGSKVELVEALPDLTASGDVPVALIAGADGAVIVASRAGSVLVRDAAGGWTTEIADPAPPTDGGHGENPPARTGPR